MARRPAGPRRVHRQSKPAAKLLHRTVQRLDAPRAAERRDIRIRARGQGRHRRMARALQHPLATPRTRWPDAGRLREDGPVTSKRWPTRWGCVRVPTTTESGPVLQLQKDAAKARTDDRT